MLAYNNDPLVKKALLDEVRWHRRADAIVRNYGYWIGGKGCSIGCLSHDPSGGHRALADLTGVPVQLLYLVDKFFENLAPAASGAWTERFWHTVPIGADLSGVWPKWVVETLRDDLLPLPDIQAWPDCTKAIQGVITLYANGMPTKKGAAARAAAEPAAAAAAARAAARAAAWAAEAAARAAWAAAWAAKTAWAAAWAAEAATEAATAAAWNRMADRLIRLVKEAQ
jgi:hypothetical protein